MTDNNAPTSSDEPTVDGVAAAPAVHSATPGWTLLRQARENSGMPLEALAAVLQVPVRKLEALEAGELNEGLDLTFSRALAASVCRQLRIDAEPILSAWPKSYVAAAKPIRGINDGAPGAATALPQAKREGAGVMWAILILLIAGVGLWLAIEQTQSSAVKRASANNKSVEQVSAAAAADAAAVPAETLSAQSQDAVALNTDTGAPALATDAAATPDTAGSESNTAGASATAPDNAAEAMQSAQGSASLDVRNSVAPLAKSDIGQHLLVLHATGESWVEVTDAFGNRVFTKIMLAGDFVALDKPASMAVVVGNAAGVVAYSKGAVVDIQAVARGNVARFDIR